MTSAKRVVVLGGGPGGYPAAFHAADLGMQVVLVDEAPHPGGVCLYRGCIPSKTLLHLARLITEAREAAAWGVYFDRPTLDIDRVRAWKNEVVTKLTAGLGQLRKRRKIEFIQGRGILRDPHSLVVKKSDGSEQTVAFDYAVLATGSRPATISGLPNSPRIWDSTAALELESIPQKLLVIGGGYIGLELGSVYAALGAQVTVVEMMPSLLPGADPDLVRPLAQRLKQVFTAIYLNTRVTSLEDTGAAIRVRLEGDSVKNPVQEFDRVLVSVGRKPNSAEVGLEACGIRTNSRGFIETNAQRQTSVPSVFAVGDVAGEPMLAHKATHEGRVAAEAIAGKKTAFDPHAIPGVVFTDPEIAWCGLTETEAKAKDIEVKAAVFPWAASGRATTLGRSDGLTKLICDPGSGRVLGVGLCGPGAGELIAEGVLAVEMGATAEDVAHSIHPHPTLSETVMEAAEVFLGHGTHVYRG